MNSGQNPAICRRKWLAWAYLPVLALAAQFLAGCATSGHLPPQTNSDGRAIDKSWTEVLSWSAQRLLRQGPPAPALFERGHLPLVQNEAGRRAAEPGELSVTWLGHASALVRMDGGVVLTDPVFTERASPFSWLGPQRQVANPYEVDALPPVSLILISHNHYDHLSLPTLKQLWARRDPKPVIFAPPGVAEFLRDEGFESARSLAWWESAVVGDFKLTAVPAYHWSGRGLLDRNRAHWGGWVVSRGPFRLYFAGDTGWGEGRDFARIGEKFAPIDLALIPVGAYEPRAFMKDQHVNPEEAVQIHRAVGARHSLGIHWGTFELTDEALDAPVFDLTRALAAQQVAPAEFRLLRVGEALDLYRQGQPLPDSAQTPLQYFQSLNVSGVQP